MKKFLQIFFMTLGVIFFILILGGVYLYVADPFGIKPLIKTLTGQSASTTTKQTITTKQTATSTADKNPLLSPAQEQALEKIGIDPATLPTTITAEMKQCLYTKLGSQRADEIRAGAEFTTSDYIAARSCL